MITDVPHKEPKPDSQRVGELGEKQARVIGGVLGELSISSAVADEFLFRQGLGHVAIEITDEPVPPDVLLEELRSAA